MLFANAMARTRARFGARDILLARARVCMYYVALNELATGTMCGICTILYCMCAAVLRFDCASRSVNTYAQP